MKTLINKNNPAFRITAPEIIEEEEYYTLDGEIVYLKECWTLVEGFYSNVDLEKAIEEEKDHYFAIKDRGFNLDSIDVERIARRFYELGLNARM